MENITKNKNWITVLIVGLFTLVLNAQHQHEKYQLLPFGSVKPTGWIKTEMQKDVAGFVGNLDRIVPDLIINSHALPSRMTVGMLIETLLGKVGCMEAELQDATPFEPVNMEEIMDRMETHGYQLA